MPNHGVVDMFTLRTMLSISLYTIWGGMQVIVGDLELALYVAWNCGWNQGKVMGASWESEGHKSFCGTLNSTGKPLAEFSDI